MAKPKELRERKSNPAISCLWQNINLYDISISQKKNRHAVQVSISLSKDDDGYNVYIKINKKCESLNDGNDYDY